MVAGKLVHTGTRVVLWMDPGGYDAYRVERRFSPFDKSDWNDSQAEVKELRNSPERYGLRDDRYAVIDTISSTVSFATASFINWV